MILITGGTGYIGRSLCEQLKGGEFRILTRQNLKGKNFVKGDVSDFDSVKRCMKGVDAVLHAAAQVDHFAPYSELYRTNVLGTENVIRAAMESGVRKVVHVSSVAASESIITPYVLSKRDAESVVKKYWKDIEIPIMRIAPVYDQERLSRVVKLPVIPMIDRDIKIHIVHKKSAATALLASVKMGKSRVYTIADRKTTSFHELYSIIMEALGEKKFYMPHSLVRYGIGLSRLAEISCRLAGLKPFITPDFVRAMLQEREYDISLAVKDLKYKPEDTEKTFREILGRMVR